MNKPPIVDALEELEVYAKERGWRWADIGHAELIRRLIAEHRAATAKEWCLAHGEDCAHPGTCNARLSGES